MDKDLEKKYQAQIRKHPHPGAMWQDVKEKRCKPCGENSPYADHAEKQSGAEDGEESREHPRANPDEHTFRPSQDIQSARLAAEVTEEVQGRVHKLMAVAKQILTEQQYTVFVLLAVKEPHLTEREAAKVMSITPGRVHQLRVKAFEKLQEAYEKRT